jgi:hypothetical protein
VNIALARPQGQDGIAYKLAWTVECNVAPAVYVPEFNSARFQKFLGDQQMIPVSISAQSDCRRVFQEKKHIFFKAKPLQPADLHLQFESCTIGNTPIPGNDTIF